MRIGRLALPLRHIATVTGDAGIGPSAPHAVPIVDGVIVNRRGAVSLFSHDLSAERWRQRVDGWASSPLHDNGRLFVGPVGGWLFEYRAATGQERHRLAYANGIAGVRAVSGDVLIIEASRSFVALDMGGNLLWRREAQPGHVVSTEASFLLSDRFERILLCIDAHTGAVRWRFEPRKIAGGGPDDRSNVMRAAFPSVSAFEGRVLVVTQGGAVYALALESGEVLSSAQAPFVGPYAVTERSVFFKQAFGLSEFDHHDMREVNRIEYRSEVEPLYAGNRPTVNAFLVTEESVVWTTMHGTLMGVSREPAASGHRTTWRYDVPGALMPIGEAPTSYGPYLYFTRKGAEPDLQCFRSEAGD